MEPAGDLLGLLGTNPMHALRIDEVEERTYEQVLVRLARQHEDASGPTRRGPFRTTPSGMPIPLDDPK